MPRRRRVSPKPFLFDRLFVELLRRAFTDGHSAATIQIPLGISLREAERLILSANLIAEKGNLTSTAQVLGIDRRTFYRKITGTDVRVRTPPSRHRRSR